MKKAMHPRMRRERKTVTVMIEIYCHLKHGSQKGTLCSDCTDLQGYAMVRLKHCLFQEGKTTCGNCPVHCYKPGMRQKIKEIMRFSGPKMIWSHPLMAIGHLIDGFRKKPKKKKRGNL